MSEIRVLNEIQIKQNGSTIAYKVGTVNGYYKAANGKFYEEALYTTEIPGLENLVYADIGNNDLYIYKDVTSSFVKVSGEGAGNNILLGYLNSTDGKFYQDSSYTVEIQPDINKLYINIIDNNFYRYVAVNSEYIRVGGVNETKDIAFTIYWTEDVAPTPNSDWTTQQATDLVQAIYDAFKNCGGQSQYVYRGRINYYSKKASDSSNLGTSVGWYTLYSNNSYSSMISDNSITRLSLDFRLYGNTIEHRYGLWGNYLTRSVTGIGSDNTVYDKNQRIAYSTISTYKGE